MLATRVQRPAVQATRLLRTHAIVSGQVYNTPWRRFASNNSRQSDPSSHWFRNSLGVAVAGTAAFMGYSYFTGDFKRALTDLQEDRKQEPVDVNELRAKFIQEKRSLKSPAVYTWGSNEYKVVDPGSKDADIKSPRRFKYFDGQVLRDFKVDEKSGAAITENGDLIQWGKGYSETEFKPTQTLAGKNLISLALSENRIIALSSNGTAYSLPISKQDQMLGPKSRESSWVPFKSGQSTLSYRILKPALGFSEKITSLKAGQEHVVLLTNCGRVFTAAASTDNYPSVGQLGVPGLKWSTRPSGPPDTCHEVTALAGCKVTQVACGDYHSLALTQDGRLFAWGDNSSGQLGMPFVAAAPFVDTPTLMKMNKLYRRRIYSTNITSIAAGGANTFFTIDAKRILDPEEDPTKIRDLGVVTADTWACGRGIWGTLGTGRWVHVQDSPAKVKNLSGLGEYDEKAQKMTPIRLRALSVGTTHVAAIMDNQTNLSAKTTDSLDKSRDFGYDALWWGGNSNFQLGTGKRSNQCRPTYILAPSESAKNPEPEARLQIMPEHKGKVGKRNVKMEQRVECGRHVSAIYSAV
ncbi:hypothetical protein N7492_008422 [Penicillium capsulatum]|uniref:Mitochondrial protein Fmp25 n=1 Tax=Penicillium capsulatum TaxID=69766 RepID=A0A9W9HSM4_9EURO|nr:hypothetical protein N7492_008422 [Penicillium capsulatum]KAJ6105824.1 hypothetical protein N7512_009341 [Penicillium capsulatum]